MQLERFPAEQRDAQAERRALMRRRVLQRLELLADEARRSQFTLRRRVVQPVEVQRLQRRLRGVTERWAPVWTTPDAASAGVDGRVQLEHVTPVVVLVERILLGDSVEDVLTQAVVCRVTYDEHKNRLAVAFRDAHADLYERMLTCPIGELSTLAWERYTSAALEPYDLSSPLAPDVVGMKQDHAGNEVSASSADPGHITVPAAGASIDDVLEFASTFNAYELIASEPRELEALAWPIYDEVLRTGTVPDWVRVDLARMVLFYAYRADHFAGGYGPYEPMHALVDHIRRLSNGLVDRRPMEASTVSSVRTGSKEVDGYIDSWEYSDDEVYRWWYERRWGSGPALCFVGLNPATGDTDGNARPTLGRVVGWAKREGAAAVVVVNLFGYRATKPSSLLAASVDIVGERNDSVIAERSSGAIITLAAWGSHRLATARAARVLPMLRQPVCVGINKDGAPAHPLFIPAATLFRPYP